MKALEYIGPKSVKIVDKNIPKAKEGKVKIDVKYCGVCGSDIGIYLGTHPRAKAPLVLGHEFLGFIAEDGKIFKKGDRVVGYPLVSCGACLPCKTGSPHVCENLKLIGIDFDGGMCEYINVDEDILYKVPKEVCDESASLIEPLAVTLRAIHQSGFKARDKVAIIGAGPIGILTGLVAKKFGAEEVFISDLSEKRLSVAKELGLTTVNISKTSLERVIDERTLGNGVDITFECSGAAQAAIEMSKITRISGTICMVSVHKHPHEVDLREINFKELSIIGSRVYTKQEFEKAVNYSKEIDKELKKIVTHILPLAQSEDVFNLISNPNNGTLKVLIDCNC